MTLSKLPPSQYLLVGVKETHYLNGEGLPCAHDRALTIKALESIDCIPFYFVPDADCDVKVLVGGRQAPLRVIGDGIHAADIALGMPLQAGERGYAQHRIEMTYAEMPPPRFCAVIGKSGAESLSLSVIFDPGRVPANVRWAEWSGGKVIPGTEVAVDVVPGDNDLPAIRRELTMVQPGTYGFYWDW